MCLQIRDDGGDSEETETMKSMSWCAEGDSCAIREMKSG
jgi:hypothetical protein